jgi:hypothetical protein
MVVPVIITSDEQRIIDNVIMTFGLSNLQESPIS